MDDIASKLVEALYAGSLAPAECRLSHAGDLLVEGRLLPSDGARHPSTAAPFYGSRRSLMARSSSCSGDPHIAQDDSGASPRGLAVRIEGVDGMDLVGHSAGGFPASDPERFLAFVEAVNAKANDPE